MKLKLKALCTVSHLQRSVLFSVDVWCLRVRIMCTCQKNIMFCTYPQKSRFAHSDSGLQKNPKTLEFKSSHKQYFKSTLVVFPAGILFSYLCDTLSWILREKKKMVTDNENKSYVKVALLSRQLFLWFISDGRSH